MFFREMEPLALDENRAVLLIGAIEREHQRLEGLAAAARDRDDRDAWALYRFQSDVLVTLRSALNQRLEDAASPSSAYLEELAAIVRARRTGWHSLGSERKPLPRVGVR